MFEGFIIYSPIWLPALILAVVVGIYFAPQFVADLTGLFGEGVFRLLLLSIPFWLPIVLAVTLWHVWLVYVRSRYVFKIEWLLLEIKIPQEVLKSPLAMETFLMSLHQTGKETTFIDRYWKGQTRATFSLEMVSIEGKIKFFIYTRKDFKGLIESGLYAQYPNIEIHEVPDYTRSVHFDPKETDLYVIDYKKKEAADALPIKTYVDYGIDREQVEEENKIDPINTIIEYLGSIGANQQFWLQIVIRAHKKEFREGLFGKKTDPWKDGAKEQIEKIRAAALQKQDGAVPIKLPNPTKGEQERMLAIERSVSKIPFDVGIRSVYWGKKDFFNGTQISGQRGILRAYSAPHLNSFSPTHWLDGFDYPWQDFRKIRQTAEKFEGLEAYKRRSFFYRPFFGDVFVMNVEELASIFHLPGQVTQTPNLTRIPSKKAQAPANLPI